MRQSQTYRRGQPSAHIDPNDYNTYRLGVALRIQRRHKGMKSVDAWQLAAIPAFFLWLFRKPAAWLKKRSVNRKLRKAVSRTNSGISRNG